MRIHESSIGAFFEAARQLRRLLRLLADVLRLRLRDQRAARSEKLTISAPPRREELAARDGPAASAAFIAAVVVAARLPARFHQPRRALDRAQDAHVRAAAAQVGVHVAADLGSATARDCASSSACARIIMPGMQ